VISVPPLPALGVYLRMLPRIVRGLPFRVSFDGATRIALNRVAKGARRRIYETFVLESGIAFREYLLGVRVDARRVRCPVLCIAGAHDLVIPPPAARAVARRYHAELLEYPGHGHWLLDEPGWEMVAADTLRWLDKIAPVLPMPALRQGAGRAEFVVNKHVRPAASLGRHPSGYSHGGSWRVLAAVLSLTALLIGFLRPSAQPDEADAQTFSRQATLTVLSDPVEVQRASGSRVPGTSGMSLVVGDRIFTAAGASARVTFFQGTEVDVAAETEIMVQEVNQPSGGASSVGIGQAVGSTVSRVTSLFNPASRFQVTTPSAVAVVRGTVLDVEVTKDKLQIFSCRSGVCDVSAVATPSA
jgi:hypothetical protein